MDINFSWVHHNRGHFPVGDSLWVEALRDMRRGRKTVNQQGGHINMSDISYIQQPQ